MGGERADYERTDDLYSRRPGDRSSRPDGEQVLSPLALMLGIGVDRPAVRRAALRAASNVVRVTRRGLEDVLDVAYRTSDHRYARPGPTHGEAMATGAAYVRGRPGDRELTIRGPAGSLAVGQFSLSRDTTSGPVTVVFTGSEVADPRSGMTRPEVLQVDPASGECGPEHPLVVTVGLELPPAAEPGAIYGIARLRATAPGYQQELLVSVLVEDF